jgi:hypothetical protein
MNKNKSLIILFMCTITLFALSGSSSFSINSSSVDTLAITRINEIRSTSNTDVSKIKGKIYYVSLNGSDSNDGLSIDRPFKTLNKINTLMSNAVIKPGDAILLNDGDIFRGNISIKTNNITIGSYGDIKKGKPKLYGSPYNLKNTGFWNASSLDNVSSSSSDNGSFNTYLLIILRHSLASSIEKSCDCNVKIYVNNA